MKSFLSIHVLFLLLVRRGRCSLDKLRANHRYWNTNPTDDWRQRLFQIEEHSYRIPFSLDEASEISVSARQIWNSNNNDTYPWLEEDGCIQHPESRAIIVELYSELAFAMTRVFVDDRLTPDLLAQIVVHNDTRQREFLTCVSMLAFSSVVESAVDYVNETTREALADARQVYLSKYPESPTDLPVASPAPSSSATTPLLARGIWDDNDSDEYAWLDDEPCIEHPELRSPDGTQSYNALATSMVNVFNDDRLTPELVNDMLINNMKFDPMSDCGTILAFSTTLEASATLVEAANREALTLARESFIARNPTEGFARDFWNDIGSSYRWLDGEVCIEHPSLRSFGYSSVFYSNLAVAMTKAFNDSRLTTELILLIRINDKANRPMSSDCGTIMDFSSTIENFVDDTTMQELIDARNGFIGRSGEERTSEGYGRVIWADNEQGSYSWSNNDPCIEHPTFQAFGTLAQFYTALAKAMASTFRDSRLTPEVASSLLINDKANRPMSECGTLLDFSPVVEVSTGLVDDEIRLDLFQARMQYMSKYPDEAFARLFWQDVSNGYTWVDDQECIEHPSLQSFGTLSEFFTSLATAMTNAFGDPRLSPQLEALVKINGNASSPMSGCGSILEFSPIVEQEEEYIDGQILQSLADARTGYEERVSSSGNPMSASPTQSVVPSVAPSLSGEPSIGPPTVSSTGSPTSSIWPSLSPSQVTDISVNTTPSSPATENPTQLSASSLAPSTSSVPSASPSFLTDATAPRAPEPTTIVSSSPSLIVSPVQPTAPSLPPVAVAFPVSAPVASPVGPRLNPVTPPPFTPVAAPVASAPVADPTVPNTTNRPSGEIITLPPSVSTFGPSARPSSRTTESPSTEPTTSPLVVPNTAPSSPIATPTSPVAPSSPAFSPTLPPLTRVPSGQPTTPAPSVDDSSGPFVGPTPTPVSRVAPSSPLAPARPVSPIAPLSRGDQPDAPVTGLPMDDERVETRE